MFCAENILLRQEHQAAILAFRVAIGDLVALVESSAADSDFTLAHRRIRATGGACEIALAAVEQHREDHGCEIQHSPPLEIQGP